ncbi:MAG: AsmA family protein [Geobacter sp.]|nr:AsmA family protein [Geobacter sp.]
MTGKKIAKIAAIVAGVVVAIIVAFAILVKVLISPEMVRKTVLPRVAAAINRQVSLGDVSISIFRGIRLKDLEVKEKDGTSFLKAGDVRLSYQFWPLLSGRVVVDEVGLERPEIRIVRNSDGTFNFSDMIKKKEQPTEAPKEKGQINLAVAEVSVKDGKVALDDRKGVAGAPFAMEISGIEVSASDVSMDREFPFKFKAALPGADVELSGKASQVAKAPAIDADFQFKAKELGKLVAALPPGIGGKIAKYSPSGAVEAKLKLAGDVKQPMALLTGGEVKLDKVQITAGNMRPTIAGLILLGRDSLSSKDLGVDVGGQRLAIDLKGANLKGKPVSLTLGVSGKQLDLGLLLPEKTGKPAAPPAAAKPEPGPINLPVQAAGSVRIGKVLYRTMEISNLAVDWQLRDNIFSLAQLKGGLAGGSFSDSARIDMTVKGFRYTNKLNVQGVQADKLVPAFAPKAAGTVFGTMSLTADVKGSGTSPTTSKRNITGGGSFAVTNGKLTGSGFVASLAAFLGSQELRVLRFSKFAGTYGIKNAIVNLDAALDGSDARFAAAGKVGFDKSLDMGIEAKFPPAITAKVARGDIGSLLTDSQGWGSIPLRATGTVGAPNFGIDASKMKGRVREKLQQKLQEKLYGKPAEGGKQPEGGLIDKTLKGIFGK